jgi:hypothetical protein
VTDVIYKQPIPGLVAFTLAFLTQWLGHAVWAFVRQVFVGHHHEVSLAVGAVGALIIWKGLKRSEISATWMGLLGGWLIWVGWFEFTFEFYAELFSVPTYTSPTGLPVGGGAPVLMATLPIMLCMLLLYGFFNRQTKCNLIRWFHRNLRVDPGMPTNDNGRSFARIAAMEALFVTWACYLFWLYVSYMLSQTAIIAAYVGWFAWFIYLLIRLVKVSRVGHAVRYGIPVGIIGWGLAEMPSYTGAYPEFWLKPLEFPLTNSIAAAAFIACFVYVARRDQSPSVPATEPG